MATVSAYKTVGSDWKSVGRVTVGMIVGPEASLWASLQRTYTVGSTVVHDSTSEAIARANFDPTHQYPSIAGLHCWIDETSGLSGGALAAAHQVKPNLTSGVGHIIRVTYNDATDLLRGPVEECGWPAGVGPVATVYLSTCVVAEEITP
jgi:hypothetical protein